MAIVAILSCDGNDIMIHLTSTFHTNILEYRIIHVLRMKIVIKKKLSRIFLVSHVPVIAFYEVKDHGVYGHRITEWFGLEGTFKITSFQPPAIGKDTSL